jgi:hypothetical protein
MSSKLCIKCCIKKTLGEFYADKRYPDGRISVCIYCKNSQRRQRIALKGQMLFPERPKTHKPCTKCGVDKSLTEFYKDGRDPTGRTSHCKLCESERKATAFATDPKVSERTRSYKTNNPEKARTRNREYKKENRERDCAHVTARNARKRNAIPPWEADVIAAETQWRKDYPGMTLDHIVPITPPRAASLGGRPVHGSNRTFVGPLIPIVYGLHTQANWQPLGNLENARKNNRDWPHSPWSNHV